jgi:DNA replicative helicase MCM subunit Mcm2 (Cdc46/Mcm family)
MYTNKQLFVVLDENDARVDNKIAERVVRNHSYDGGSAKTLMNMISGDSHIEPEIVADEDVDREIPVYEKHNATLYGNINHDIISQTFLK